MVWGCQLSSSQYHKIIKFTHAWSEHWVFWGCATLYRFFCFQKKNISTIFMFQNIKKCYFQLLIKKQHQITVPSRSYSLGKCRNRIYQLTENWVVVVLRSPIHGNEPSEYNGTLYYTSNWELNNGIKVIILICIDGTSQYHNHRKLTLSAREPNICSLN